MGRPGRRPGGKPVEWLQKYIDLKSDLNNEMTEKEMAEYCGLTPVGLMMFKKRHPELQKLINDNLKKQGETMWEKSHRLAFKKMEKSDKILQIVLEMTGQYNNPDTLNRYLAMSRDMLLQQIKAKLNGLGDLKQSMEKDQTDVFVSDTQDIASPIHTEITNSGTDETIN